MWCIEQKFYTLLYSYLTFWVYFSVHSSVIWIILRLIFSRLTSTIHKFDYWRSNMGLDPKKLYLVLHKSFVTRSQFYWCTRFLNSRFLNFSVLSLVSCLIKLCLWTIPIDAFNITTTPYRTSKIVYKWGNNLYFLSLFCGIKLNLNSHFKTLLGVKDIYFLKVFLCLNVSCDNYSICVLVFCCFCPRLSMEWNVISNMFHSLFSPFYNALEDDFSFFSGYFSFLSIL